MKDVLPVMGYTAVMGIAVYFVRINTGSDVTGLLWGTLAGIVSYIIVTFGFRAKEMRYLMNIIKSNQPDK